MPWTFEEYGRNAHLIKPPPHGNRTTWEFWLFFASDIHFDHPDCNLDLLRSHLDLAKSRNAPIVLPGDFFCAMQGPGDRRQRKGHTRPEHDVLEYYDALARTAADFLDPYRDLITVLGLGNHETGVLRHAGVNLTERLAERLRDRGGLARAGGYGGFLRLRMAGKRDGGTRQKIDVRYFHGSGGGGPVNKGMSEFARWERMAEADIYVGGHNHHRNMDDGQRMYLNLANRIQYRRVLKLRCGPYKDDLHGDGHSGYLAEKGCAPRTLGGWFVRFYKESARGQVCFEARDPV